MTPQNNPKILYLAYDLSDAGIEKRTTMLADGGARVRLAGFHRTKEPVASVAGCPTVNFGQTFNGGFAQRLWSVLKLCVSRKYKACFADADILLARNLEMLAIAVSCRRFSAKKPVIVYECLDIHRFLLGRGPVSMALRALEGWLMTKTSAILTSSPSFISEYFNPRYAGKLPIRLVENKVYPTPATSANAPRPAGPPWKIGWFGIIRCRKSLDILTQLVRMSQGQVEVIIRGRPALDQFEDFHKTASSTPGLKFLGPYKSTDLAEHYREVHFSWAIDMFEEGLNSAWLLPNRLYEGGLSATVPIAMKNVETGRTIDRMGIGLSVPSLSADWLHSYFPQLTADQYRTLETQVQSLPFSTWSFNRQDCTDLVAWLEALRG